jgi:membrane-associated phospholipid phosphatase
MNTTEFIIGLSVLDLILPQLIFCGILYMIWWVHKPFFIPFFFSVVIFIICFIFKFAFGERKEDLISPFQTCMLLTIPKYTLPSVHSALGVYLCIHFTIYYLKTSSLSPSILNQDPPVTNWPKFRVGLIWIYFVLLCFSRIHLQLNHVLDIIVGCMIGLIAGFVESWIYKKQKKEKNGD